LARDPDQQTTDLETVSGLLRRPPLTPFPGVSKLIDAVVFWHGYGVPETHLRAKSDTRRLFWAKKRVN
jgi:hypothetical protein